MSTRSDAEATAALEAARITAAPQFRQLYRARERVRWALTGAALVVLGGYTALVGWGGLQAAGKLSPSTAITWGLLAAVLSMVLGACIAGAYVIAAERYFDRHDLPAIEDSK